MFVLELLATAQSDFRSSVFVAAITYPCPTAGVRVGVSWGTGLCWGTNVLPLPQPQ